MVRDNQGYLWLGTQGGINKFDGMKFKAYLADGKSNKPSGNWITGCVKDAQGNLWFSTRSNGLTHFDVSQQTFKHFNSDNLLGLNDDRITSIELEQGKLLWIGTHSGVLYKLRLATMELSTYQSLTRSINKINNIKKDENGTLWLATASGLFLLNDDDSLIHVRESNPNIKEETQEIWTLTPDTSGGMWIGAKTGLFQLTTDKTGYDLTKILTDLGWITSIEYKKDNLLWLATYGKGLAAFDITSKQFQLLQQNDKQPQSLKNNYLISLFKETDNQLWIGTDGKGLLRYLDSRNMFNHTKKGDENNNTLSHNFVRAITQDHEKNLWVGTRNGANKKAPHETKFQQYLASKESKYSLPNNNVFAIHTTSRGDVWFGTYGGGLSRYNKQDDNFTTFTSADGLPSNYIYSIASNTEGHLFLGTNAGLAFFNVDTYQSTSYQHNKQKPNSLSQNTVVALLDDPNGYLWIGTFLGLNRFDKQSKSFVHYNKSNSAISDNMVTSLHLSKAGKLWVGTMNGLSVLDVEHETIETYSQAQGLPNGNIFGILEDEYNRLWLSTNNGLAKFDVSKKIFTKYTVGDGLQDRSFILGAHYKNAQGELFFGGVNGFNQFTPSSIVFDETPPKVIFEGLLLFNKSVPINAHTVTSKNDRFIDINYTNTMFTLQFTSPGATYPNKLEYSYKLSGFDEQWISTTYQNKLATYTNMSAGRYQLQVRARYPGQEWGQTSTISIRVSAAPWLSLPAFILYLGVIVSIGYTYWRLYRKRKLAEIEKKNSEALSLAKDELLANVSHEFKTPLTLILGPTNDLLQTSDKTLSPQLSLIKRNAEKLNDLVTNILEKGVVDSRVGESVSDLAHVCSRAFQAYLPLAQEKSIEINFQSRAKTPAYSDIEPQKLEIAISNLLSNAIKYSSKQSSIRLILVVSRQRCKIMVVDKGAGIDGQNIDKIFTRHYRVDTNHKENGQGIGLAYVKSIIEEAAGDISVRSQKNKQTCFTITLPINRLAMQTITDKKKHAIKTIDQTDSKKNLLIVDDNTEIRKYLYDILSPTYNCTLCADGAEALASAAEQQPDIVVTDVMMPNVDGLTLLSKLRDNQDTSHIPVLLLSAYPAREIRIRRLMLHGDEFLAKPFYKEELMAAIDNMVFIRKWSQHTNALSLTQATKELSADQNSMPDSNSKQTSCPKDNKFMQSIDKHIQTHYQDPSFSLQALSRLMFTSDRNLQIKTKALFDMSPVDLIRDVRLHHAAKMLISETISIGEISQQCGFGSQSYFSKCFKEKYDCSPNSFRKKKPISAE
jgi:ligand-binding sensor domain-containing protein/signal transduction histidine kinase/AraC-like DNA-binding protein